MKTKNLGSMNADKTMNLKMFVMWSNCKFQWPLKLNWYWIKSRIWQWNSALFGRRRKKSSWVLALALREALKAFSLNVDPFLKAWLTAPQSLISARTLEHDISTNYLQNEQERMTRTKWHCALLNVYVAMTSTIYEVPSVSVNSLMRSSILDQFWTWTEMPELTLESRDS